MANIDVTRLYSHAELTSSSRKSATDCSDRHQGGSASRFKGRYSHDGKFVFEAPEQLSQSSSDPSICAMIKGFLGHPTAGSLRARDHDLLWDGSTESSSAGASIVGYSFLHEEATAWHTRSRAWYTEARECVSFGSVCLDSFHVYL